MHYSRHRLTASVTNCRYTRQPMINGLALFAHKSQGDRLSGKPGNVKEFETCQGKNLVRDKCPKTVHY